MKSIDIKIQNKYGNYIYKIIKHFNTNGFKWNLFDDEVYNRNGDYFFEKNIYNDIDLKKKINSEAYYIVSMKLIGKNLNGDYITIIVSDCVFVSIESNMLALDDIEKNCNNIIDDLDI